MTLIWGPRAWLLVHYLTYNANNNPKELKKYEIFFDNFDIFIPCPMCVDFYNKEKKLIKINFPNKTSLIKWGIDIHNYVNKRLHKKEMPLHQSNEIYSKITINYQKLIPYFDILKNIALYKSYLLNKDEKNKQNNLIFLKKYADQFILLSELFPNSDFKKKFQNHINKNNPKNIFTSTFDAKKNKENSKIKKWFLTLFSFLH